MLCVIFLRLILSISFLYFHIHPTHHDNYYIQIYFSPSAIPIILYRLCYILFLIKLQAKKLSLAYADNSSKFHRKDKRNITEQQMNLVVDTFLKSLIEYQWWSFSLCKMLVALACATGHSKAAIKLIRYVNSWFQLLLSIFLRIY